MIKESALFGAMAKCAAIGTSITGAIAAVDSSSMDNAETSVIFCALGLITYGTLRIFFVNGYERTRHISPAENAENKPHKIQHQKYSN
jgi:hypothetical protein